jgi:hypothetical protein
MLFVYAIVSLLIVSSTCFQLSVNTYNKRKYRSNLTLQNINESNIKSGYQILSKINACGAMYTLLTASVNANAPVLPSLNDVLKSIGFIQGYVIAILLESAAARSRLDGGTFKILNLAMIISSLAHVIPRMRAYRPDAIGFIITCLLLQSLLVGVPVLRVYGLPTIEVSCPDLLSTSFMVYLYAMNLFSV